MAHKRSTSRFLVSGSSSAESAARTAHLTASFSSPAGFPLPSLALSHSASLPSMQSVTSDMTNLTSYPSSGTSSISGFSSFSSSISADHPNKVSWPEFMEKSADDSPGLWNTRSSQPSPFQVHRSPLDHSTPKNRGFFAEFWKSYRGCTEDVASVLPYSLWERIVLVAFFWYLVVFTQAMAGFGGDSSDIQCYLGSLQIIAKNLSDSSENANGTYLLDPVIHSDLGPSNGTLIILLEGSVPNNQTSPNAFSASTSRLDEALSPTNVPINPITLDTHDIGEMHQLEEQRHDTTHNAASPVAKDQVT